jgi:hypothetical protein
MSCAFEPQDIDCTTPGNHGGIDEVFLFDFRSCVRKVIDSSGEVSILEILPNSSSRVVQGVLVDGSWDDSANARHNRRVTISFSIPASTVEQYENVRKFLNQRLSLVTRSGTEWYLHNDGRPVNLKITGSTGAYTGTGRTYNFVAEAENAFPSRLVSEDAGKSIWQNGICWEQNNGAQPVIQSSLLAIALNALDYAYSEGPEFLLMQPYDWLVENHSCPEFIFPCYEYKNTIIMQDNSGAWTWAALFYPSALAPSLPSYSVLVYLSGQNTGISLTYTSNSSQPAVSPIENEDYVTGWVVF